MSISMQVMEQNTIYLSPCVGTLVSEQGVDAAFRLVWKGSAMCLDSYSCPLASGS